MGTGILTRRTSRGSTALGAALTPCSGRRLAGAAERLRAAALTGRIGRALLLGQGRQRALALPGQVTGLLVGGGVPWGTALGKIGGRATLVVACRRQVGQRALAGPLAQVAGRALATTVVALLGCIWVSTWVLDGTWCRSGNGYVRGSAILTLIFRPRKDEPSSSRARFRPSTLENSA